jgi:hypothetical protein
MQPDTATRGRVCAEKKLMLLLLLPLLMLRLLGLLMPLIVLLGLLIVLLGLLMPLLKCGRKWRLTVLTKQWRKTHDRLSIKTRCG